MKTFILLVFIVSSLTACEQGEILPGFLQFNKTTIADKLNTGNVIRYADHRELSYGSDLQFHKFDMSYPVFENNHQPPSVAIIMIHGGSWYFLNKGFNEGAIHILKNKKKNIMIFNINLRLTQVEGITYQHQMEDIDLFISFLNKNKERYNLTGDYILWGYSSGGHLALTYSYMNPKNKRIKAVTSVAGPTDLTDQFIRDRLYMDNKNLTELAVGTKYAENPASFKAASPYYCVKRNATPTILFYAGKDDVVPPSHGELLAYRLKEKKNKVALYTFENNSHNIESMDESFEMIFEFLKEIRS